jgi:hypothetical protein
MDVGDIVGQQDIIGRQTLTSHDVPKSPKKKPTALLLHFSNSSMAMRQQANKNQVKTDN